MLAYLEGLFVVMPTGGVFSSLCLCRRSWDFSRALLCALAGYLEVVARWSAKLVAVGDKERYDNAHTKADCHDMLNQRWQGGNGSHQSHSRFTSDT